MAVLLRRISTVRRMDAEGNPTVGARIRFEFMNDDGSHSGTSWCEVTTASATLTEFDAAFIAAANARLADVYPTQYAALASPLPDPDRFLLACTNDATVIPEHLPAITVLMQCANTPMCRPDVWTKLKQMDLPVSTALTKGPSETAIEAHAVAANMPLTP
jgi:hypothetical protein